MGNDSEPGVIFILAKQKESPVVSAALFLIFALCFAWCVSQAMGSDDSTNRTEKGSVFCFTGSTQPDVVGFFNGALLAVNAQTGFVKEDDDKAKGEQLLPVERCEVFNESSRFCFLELRNEGYTVLCIKLDGRCHDVTIYPFLVFRLEDIWTAT